MELESHKKHYPFRLAAPSYIYPADYVTNVKQLGMCLDEIELLLFESAPGSLPSPEEIDQLVALQHGMDLRYNVHLPLDINLGAKTPGRRDEAVKALQGVFDLIRPLRATTHTLHLPFNAPGGSGSMRSVKDWQDRTMLDLDRLLNLIKLDPRSISVETLDYPPSWLTRLVDGFDLSVCVDVGHVVRYGYNLQSVFSRFHSRIAIWHLHGVRDGKDHLALHHLNPKILALIGGCLADFTQSVSLEVFSLQRLNQSMRTLAVLMKQISAMPKSKR